MQMLPIFLINLDKSIQRLDKCKQVLDEQGLAFERVAAVYGADLTDSDIQHIYPDHVRNRYYKKLNVGELGCYLSHRKIWQKMVDEQIEAAVILEDDIKWNIDNISTLFNAVSVQNGWDYIKLSSRSKKLDSLTVSNWQGFEVHRVGKVPTRTGAQIVSLSGAKKLLKHAQVIARPIDVDLKYWWEIGIAMHVVWPHPVGSCDDDDSEIEKMGQRSKAKKHRFKKIAAQIHFYILCKWHSMRVECNYG